MSPYPPQVSEHFNHTFWGDGQEKSFQCPCEQEMFLKNFWGNASEVVICPQCGSWHSVLFESPYLLDGSILSEVPA